MSAQTDEPVAPEEDLPPVEEDVPEAPDEDEAEQDADPKQDDEAKPEADDAPLSEKQLEALNKKLENENKRHTSAVGRIMGDDATALVKCEACDENIAGFHWPAEVFPPGSPERAMYELLSGGSDAQLVHPAYFERCHECNGYTKVLTGARDGVTQTLLCPKCGGQGYLDLRNKPAAVVTLPSPATAPGESAESPADDVPRDFNGRPAGHVRFGVLNNFLTRAQWEEDRAAGLDVGDTFIGIAG